MFQYFVKFKNKHLSAKNQFYFLILNTLMYLLKIMCDIKFKKPFFFCTFINSKYVIPQISK